MAKIEDRHRSFVVDGRPVATGVAPVADSWACTNPSVGRGATIGLIHAQALRDLVRERGLDDPVAFANAWHDITVERVEPLYRDTLAFDRHRLGEIDAQIAGVPYETEDPELGDRRRRWPRQVGAIPSCCVATSRSSACSPEPMRSSPARACSRRCSRWPRRRRSRHPVRRARSSLALVDA